MLHFLRPFDPEKYEDEIEDEDSLDEEGRARLKLKVENTIRSVLRFKSCFKCFPSAESD